MTNRSLGVLQKPAPVARKCVFHIKETLKKGRAFGSASWQRFRCDVADASSIDTLFEEIKQRFDFLSHAIGFSDKSELQGRYVDTSLNNFRMTMDISVYSFTAVAQGVRMTEGGQCSAHLLRRRASDAAL